MFLYVGSFLLIKEFESWITSVCCPNYLVILHTMWSGKIMQLRYILPFDMLCLSSISMMFVNILFAVFMVVSMVV